MMKITIATLIGFWTAFSACAADANMDLVNAMVEFDRAYIPALALTSQGKSDPSKQSLEGLLNNWDDFKKTYSGKNDDDTLWQTDFARIDQHIHEAEKIVADHGDLNVAHEELEDIRIIMLNLRRRNGILYYVDALTEFHEPMEVIALWGKDKKSRGVVPENGSELTEHLEDALRLWAQVVEFPLDRELFNFDNEKLSAIEEAVKLESEALQRLEATLRSGESAELVERAIAVKPNFARLFMMFGDFSTLREKN